MGDAVEVTGRPVQMRVAVDDASAVGLARRESQAVGRAIGMPDAALGTLALIVSELATNALTHGRGGELLLVARGDSGAPSVDVLTVDRGPGMADIERCLADGYSTAGSLGVGLGAVRRLATVFDAYSREGHGAVVMARLVAGRPVADTNGVAWGVVSRPVAGEVECGDAWRVHVDGDGARLVVADGLGHGPLAAEAAERAGDLFDAHPELPTDHYVAAAHRALAGTRGAALWAGRLQGDTLLHTGAGNIAGRLVINEATRGLMSYNGTVGHVLTRVHALETPWPRGGVLVVHSDGLQTRWQADAYPGLWNRHPAVIAGVLYRDLSRGRDDATVLVLARRNGR